MTQSNLRTIAHFLERHRGNRSVYFVGGVVRDLLGGIPEQSLTDFDLLVDGPVEPLVRAFASELDGTVKLFPDFLTGKVTTSIGTIDFAQARSESYRSPGALPSVTPSTVETDLTRRDFTVNALLLSTVDDTFRHGPITSDVVIDKVSGVQDLRNKVLRVFHEQSFIDDPTRILRGVRYAGRINGKFEAGTDALVSQALSKNCFASISKKRSFQEIDKLFEEDNLEGVFKVWEELKLSEVFPFIPFELALKAREVGAQVFSMWWLPLLLFQNRNSGEQFLKESGVSSKKVREALSIEGDEIQKSIIRSVLPTS